MKSLIHPKCRSRAAPTNALAKHPPHRSQRAELPHWAPTLGNDVKALPGTGVADPGVRKPAHGVTVHPFPIQSRLLAASTQCVTTETGDLVSVEGHRTAITWDSVVLIVTLQHSSGLRACHRDWCVHPLANLLFE